MPKVEGIHFSLMTYNIGGGRNDSLLKVDSLVQVIQENSPDILALQEAAEWQDAAEQWHSIIPEINKALKNVQGAYFGPTLSMRKHFHSSKSIFVQGLFNDWLDWCQGNAILSHWPFGRLGDPSKSGEPRNLPLFRPTHYEGNRDTDPRYALLTRINRETVSPFIICTHLSTLRGERGGAEREIPGKAEEAQAMRAQQVFQLINLLRDHPLKRKEIVFLMGDFNAPVDEKCLQDLLEAGFVHLLPENPDTPTHLFKVKEPIDHIFIYPAERLISYKCRIVDTPLAREASDHLPLVADVSVI